MDTLTKREKEVALLVAEGLSNREIARRLHITEKTVENHLTVIYGKVGIKSRAQLICLILQEKNRGSATNGNLALVESGAVENNGIVYNPFTSWIDSNGNVHFLTTQDNLFPGGWYLFRVSYAGNGKWRAEWMDGNNVWHIINDNDLGIFQAMNNFGSGGYSDGCCSHFGDISTSINRWIRWKDNAVLAYCYNIFNNQTPNNQGSITPCGANQDWDVSY
ncbi:MAG: helix-turn-helix transcriptional regulator [Chloroflexi bacterium]|nr:helix-turn-helix transcriptional regulator [Chloroflexota bacterium]